MPNDARAATVLWLEAESPQTRALCEELTASKSRRFQITRVCSLRDALRELACRAFDVLVAALHLPDAEGLAVLEEIHGQAPQFPIVLLLGTEDDSASLAALNLGVKEFLAKAGLTRALLERSLLCAIERKRLEQPRRAGENQLRYILEDAPFCVAMFDTGMRYMAASPMWIETYRPNGNLIGLSHYEAFPDIPERWKEFHRRGLAGEIIRMEVDNWPKSDGTEQWLRWAIHPWRDPGGEIGGIIITVEDITARVQAEQMLRFHENLLEETGHIAKVGGWEFEASTGKGFWTREVALIHELDPDVQPSREFGLSFYVPESRERVAAALADALRNGTAYDLELELITARGNHRWIRTIAHPVMENGRVTRIRGSFQDVTERRMADEILRRQASLLEQSHDAVVVWERQGKIVYWNRGAELLFGFSHAEASGRNPAELLQTSPVEGDFHAILDCLGVSGKWEGELEQTNKSGKRIRVESRMVQIADGRTFVLETHRDVTEKRLLEEQLRQSQKMEAVGRLAGGVAHDFNNLLGVILGCTELIADARDVGEIRKRVADIQKAAERAADLTRQLLSFSRKQLVKPQLLAPRAKLLEMSSMLSRLVGDDVELRYSLPEDLGNLRIDPTQLEQIVLNLVVNAREAMPQGGKIQIEAQNVEFEEAAVRSHFSIRAGRYLMIAVTDTGIGMDTETVRHIFEPFFTTKPSGTGLGLATVYGAVKQSGGTIWVYSEPGHGTSFKVYFPRADEAAPAPRPAAPRAPSALANETILLVEDSDALREVTLEFLRASGYRVLEAGDPADALRVAGGHAGPIHLLLTDVIMPGCNGRELAAKLQPLHPETRVLYMSGYAGNALIHQGALEEGITLLSKPFSRNELMEKIRELLAPVG